MAFLRKRRIAGHEYYYIVESRRRKRDGKVQQKTLEYLGRDPDPARLRAAMRYWKVGAKKKAPQGKGRGR